MRGACPLHPALAAFLLLGALAGAARADDDGTTTRDAPLTDREKAIHVLSRLAFGPSPGQVDEVCRMGWKAWVDRQLEPEKIDDGALEKRLQGFQSLSMTSKQLMERYTEPPKNNTPAEQRRVNQLRQVPKNELQTSVLLRAVHSERQLQEVMVEFWRNHFCIAVDKDQCQYIAPAYEREVIRQHVFGRFEDLLMASAKHPAMLIYLDNVLSQRPLTPEEEKALQKAGDNKSQRLKQLERQRGLNENYARELLELHTLGVDRYYDQRDVYELARALTGWTVSRGPKGSWEFWFQEQVHDPGIKRVLGVKLGGARMSGLEEGELIIRGLAYHKGTAQFIAEKMCRYLVTDDPPEEMVDRVAKVFRKTKGDLREVTRAVIEDPLFFERRFFKTKFKTPFEFVVSALRIVGAEIKKPDAILRLLQRMRQPVYLCPDPTGYYDTAEAWLDPGVLALRWQAALDLSERSARVVDIPDHYLQRAPQGVALQHWLAAQIVPHGTDAPTQRVIDRMILQNGTGPIVQRRIVGLLLGSPEFQRQ